MSKKRTPIEEMTREQLVQSAAQYKSLYNKAIARVQEMAANYERLYKSLQSEKDCRKVDNERAESKLEELQEKCSKITKDEQESGRRLQASYKRNAQLAEEIVTQKDRIQRIKSDIENYNALPWWKRIFMKMHTSE